MWNHWLVKVVTKVSGVFASARHSNLQKCLDQFLIGSGKILFSFWAAGCSFLIVWCRCVQIPRASWNPPYTSEDRWVQKFDSAEEIKRIDFQIQRKRFQSAKQWLLLTEALRRLQSGDDLVRGQLRDEVEAGDSSDLEPLNSFLRLEKSVARGLYESCCVLTAELSLLDERKSLLVEAQNKGPIRNASLHIHRNSQLQVVNLNSINLRLQEDRTALPSGSGNRLIAPGEEQDFRPAWQDPPGLL